MKFEQMGINDGATFTTLSNHIYRHDLFMQFKPQDIANKLYGFGILRRTDTKLFKSASAAIMRRPELWSEFKESEFQK